MKWNTVPRGKGLVGGAFQNHFADKNRFKIVEVLQPKDWESHSSGFEGNHARLKIRVGREYIPLIDIEEKSFEITQHHIEKWKAMTRKEILALPFADELKSVSGGSSRYEFHYTHASGFRAVAVYDIVKAYNVYSNPNHGYYVTTQHERELELLNRGEIFETRDEAMQALEENTQEVLRLYGEIKKG